MKGNKFKSLWVEFQKVKLTDGKKYYTLSYDELLKIIKQHTFKATKQKINYKLEVE